MHILDNSEKKFNNIDIVAVFVCFFFYLCFCFIGGVEICADSAGYINMISAREPVYPLFLAFLRLVIGNETYLSVVVLLQNILMAVAVWLSSTYLVRYFKLNQYMFFAFASMHFAVAFLCQFAAGRSSIYSNSIMTEGITMSCWIIFMILVWQLIHEFNFKTLICAELLALIMMDTRKQMMIAYVVLCGSVFFGYIGKKVFWKNILITVGCCIISILLAVGVTRVYNLMLRGEFAQNTRDMNLVLTTTLYIADEDDGRLIEDENVRELFDITYQILDEKKCIMKYAGDTWQELEEHYEDSFDKITVDTTKNLFVEYAMEKGFQEGLEAEREADRMSSVIVKSLLADNLGSYVKVYGASVLNGLINSIAKRNRILDVYSLFAYLGYIALMIMCLIKKETRQAGLVGLSTLIAVVGNICVIAALIFCQSRYTMYSMALFYSCALLMIYVLIKSMREKKVEVSK